MTSNPGRTKVDLRALMKKQRQEKTTNVQRIDSPLAKYNSLGQLTCIVCNIPVKSEIIWKAHIQGKKHRENLEHLKSNRPATGGVARQESHKTEAPILPTSSKLKRKVEPDSANEVTKKLPAKVSPNFPAQKPKSEKKHKKTEVRKDAPKSETTSESPIQNSESAIPEGFFDDPTIDAKVRKVEVKNTAEEEWAKFQKEMEQQQQASQVIMEADEEAAQVSRNITEIDEQIQRFANVEKLRDKQEAWKAHKLEKQHASQEDSGSSEDEDGYAEFLDWRSKGIFK